MSPPLPKTRIALIAAVVMGLLCLSLVGAAFWAARPAAPRITVQVIKAAHLADSVVATCEVCNLTSTKWNLVPVRLETNDGTGWKSSSQGLGGYSSLNDILPPDQAGKLVCTMKRLPPGTRSRLVFQNHETLKGLRSFTLRLKLRFTGKHPRISLNPLDDTMVIFRADPVEIVSEEFTSP
jgi:hypothetical protein